MASPASKGGDKVKEEEFRDFLKKGGRSQSATNRAVRYTKEFEAFLSEQCNGKSLEEVEPEDLDNFVNWLESEPKASAKGHLWGLRYYFEFTSKEEMRGLAGVLREQRIQRTPFLLRDFRGANPKHIEKLAAAGIKNINQMLKRGSTPQDREGLAELTNVPPDTILEFVKLSDLARIPGVKGIRARLYVDAGVDTIEKMAQWDPTELTEMIREYVERTGFDGVPTLPAEARFTVKKAKELPKIVAYK
jgi:putative heme iron utilization protein